MALLREIKKSDEIKKNKKEKQQAIRILNHNSTLISNEKMQVLTLLN